jgi:hypothetical protein
VVTTLSRAAGILGITLLDVMVVTADPTRYWSASQAGVLSHRGLE